LPSITRKPGVAGMFRAPWAARAAAVRRVTRGVERMLGGDNQILVLLERGSWGGFGLLGGHGCGCEGKVVSVDVLEG
jgi:hypothetical protein